MESKSGLESSCKRRKNGKISKRRKEKKRKNGKTENTGKHQTITRSAKGYLLYSLYVRYKKQTVTSPTSRPLSER